MVPYFPKYFTSKAIILYFISLMGCFLLYYKYTLPLMFILLGSIEVIGFYYYSNDFTRRWSKVSLKSFTKKLFITAFIIRAMYVIVSYFYYYYSNGTFFEMSAGDSIFYDEMGRYGSNMISHFEFNFVPRFNRYAGPQMAISDMGYPIYLSFAYFIVGKSMLIARLLKAVWGAWTCVLVYKIATRNFDEKTGRIAGILTLLMPNLIFYCGLHLKEVEMVFLTVLFIERTDYLLRSREFNFINAFIPLLVATVLFTFRTVLGISLLFSFLTALILSSEKILGFGKRFVIGLWLIVVLVFFTGGSISNEVEQTWQNRNLNQKTTLEWRSKRIGGNKYAKYAGAAIFAPAIFIIPIPTMVNIPVQQDQMMIHGGNYIKEIISFFLIVSMIFLIKNKIWMNNLLVGSFLLGYLLIMAMSAFAQSERFHQPALPFILIFAAHGITHLTNSTKKYFAGYMVFIFVIIIAWNWFKLSGKGMI